MASEKELFVTKQYVPMEQPMVQNENTIIYKVKCLAEPGSPVGILKMYRQKNIQSLYTRLYQLDYSEWPHIYNVKFFDGNTLVVEEYLEGNTLAELLEQNRARNVSFTEEEAYQIMDRLCDCIQQLMQPEPPIIHHNLKPSNIFVTSAGAIKLLDFVPGFSKPKNPFRSLWRTLGNIFHQMLTGEAPKNGKCTYDGRYETVIRKCMEKNPEKQYKDIAELKEELEYTNTHFSKKAPRGIAGIPYALTYPFQGFLLAIEWSLIAFFWFRGNQTTMCLFVIIFVLHSIVFAIQRHSFLKKRNIHLSTARKAFPVLLLAIILFCLFQVISFIN